MQTSDLDFISFTPEKLRQFKEAYEPLKNKPEELFTFDGREVLVGYAKYVIEYLDGRMQ